MKATHLIDLLTSRGFAIFLLAVSVVGLAVWSNFPESYSHLFLALPLLLLLSLIFCTVKRILTAGSNKGIRFWASTTFHAGMIIGVLVIFLSPLTRYSARITGIQGMTAESTDARFVDIIETPRLGEAAPLFSFRLDGYDAQYKDDIYPVDYAADAAITMLVKDKYEQSKNILRINQPATIQGYKFLLEDGGRIPYFTLRKEGRLVFEGFVRLSTTTKQEDSFDLKDQGITVWTRFFPDVFIKDGKTGTKSPVPRNPAYGIKIAADGAGQGEYLYSGILKPGNKAEFNGMSLELVELKPFAVVLVANDPMYYWVFIGWALGIAGLVVRYIPDRLLRLAARKKYENP